MSAAEADRFMTALEADLALGERLATLREDSAAVHALVRAEGFDCTPEEIKAAFIEAHGAELTPEQLDAIAGGLSPYVGTAAAATTGVMLGVIGYSMAGAAGAAAAV